MDTSTLDDYVRTAGADPEDTFRTALERVGSDTRGPDSQGQYTSNCPAHPDARASLRWTKTPNWVVKFHCLAGCEYADVMARLSLKAYQLRPVRYDFDYYDKDGEYRFTVRRTQSADDSKRFTQYRRAVAGSGESDVDGNGLEDDEAFFWLEPELESAIEDARANGTKLRLWVPEGEKDTVAIAGSGSLEDWDFVTTAPGGADGWKGAHTARAGDLWDRGILSEIVIVADPDAAGMKRGFGLRDVLAEALPDLPVRVLTVELGQDVADLCDEYGRKWVEKTRELTEAEITEALEEGTAVSGFMVRYKLGVGAKPGRLGMAISSGRDKDGPTPVLSAELNPVSQWEGGWVVRVVGPRREPHEVVLHRTDLASKAGFDRWLVREARVAMVPRCGVSAGEVAQSLGVWLDWACDVRSVPKVIVTEHLTWVDPASGEPAKNVSVDAARQPVWVNPDPEPGTPVRWVGADRAGSTWGREGTEEDAAWAMARALTFGDEETVVGVAGWAAAMLLSPWLGRWMPTKPGLAVIAPSGSGKTHGAPRALLQLVGCDGSSTSSIAALRRRLAQGGVSAIQWIDDSAILDDHHLKEILRTATSQTEHTLANPDAGATATNSAKLVGCVVVSAEGVAWADEVAMQDRFLFVHPKNPQNRVSERADRAGSLQWADVQELNEEWASVEGLTALARWTVDGVSSRGVLDKLPGWVGSLRAPKGRGDVGAFVASVGARAVATWLYGVKGRMGDAWPGNSPEWNSKRYNSWAWMVEEADRQLTLAREAGPRFNSLVNTVIPAALDAEKSGVSGKGMTALVLEGVNAIDENRMRSSVYAAVQHGEHLATALPLVLVDHERRVWIWTKGLADWYGRTHRGGIGKAEERVHGVRALADQMTAVEDNPGWAVWTEPKGGGRSYNRTGVRIGKREAGANRAVYRRLSDDASEVLIGREDGRP